MGKTLYIKYEKQSLRMDNNLFEKIQYQIDRGRLLNYEITTIQIKFTNDIGVEITGTIYVEEINKMWVYVEGNSGRQYPVVYVPSFVNKVVTKDCVVSFNPYTSDNVIAIEDGAKYMNVEFSGRVEVVAPFGFNNIRAYGLKDDRINVLSVFDTSGIIFDSYVADANLCIPVELEGTFERDNKVIVDLFKVILRVGSSDMWRNRLKQAAQGDYIEIKISLTKHSNFEINGVDLTYLYTVLSYERDFALAIYKLFHHYHKPSWHYKNKYRNK